ncbi:MAG TPA: hypothetical protein VJ761_12805 [Ktedonobacteraceae bacterium]|nr:hypothetical protein [Ktedonobacteraceae bacterium]
MKEANTDPLGFYQLWLNSLKEGQEQMMQASTQGMQDSREAWKQWLDATMATWRKTAETRPDPLGLSSQWLKLMDAVQEKLLAGGSIPADPFTFLKEWYDAVSESWSSVVEHTLASEEFLEFNKQFLESYASFSKAFRRANEEYLRVLQLPSRSDISHVSELVVALEEKIDRIEDRFEDVDAAFSQTAKSEDIVALKDRLLSVESKVEALYEQLEQFKTVKGLAQHIEQVEGKLDTILAELSKIEAYKPNGHATSKAPASQKPRKRQASQSETKKEHSEAGS